VRSGPALILVIEDEIQYRQLLELNLTASGYAVSLAPDARTGLHRLIEEDPDLVLLDLRLPDFSGMQLCREIRRFSAVPIIMVTARSEQEDVIAGLNAGADDYVTKPFGIDVLLARIQANLRRRALERAATTSAIVRTGYLTVDRSRQIAFIDGVEVELTDIEFRLLDLLARNVGHVVTNATILETIWGPGHEDSVKVLRQSIYRLRQKIERNPAEPVLILSRSRQGYILVNLTEQPAPAP